MVLKRGTITIINIFFPPLGVALLCGLSYDLFINSMLFLCAIIPGHIHAFYISFTYFSRKRKVRRGKYPGDLRPMIYCERVQNGGASRREVDKLMEEMLVEEEMKREGLLSKTGSRISNRKSGYANANQSPTSPASGQSQWTRPAGRDSASATPQHASSSYANRVGRRSQKRNGYDEQPEMGEYGRGNGSTRRRQRV